MRTYFLLNKDRVKIAVVPPKSIKWNRSLYSPGSFTIELPASMYSRDFKYVYKDGGSELGVIQKYEYKYTLSEGKHVILSGSFIESLLYNIPLTMYNPLRQLDSFDGYIVYDLDYPPPTGYSKTLKTENQFIAFTAGSRGAVRLITACYACAQIAEHEYNRFIKGYELPLTVRAFDLLASTPVTQEALDKIVEQDDKGPYSTETPEGPDYPDDGTDDQGRQYYKVQKGDSVYLGDIIYNWLNGYWCKVNEADYPTITSEVPPYHPILKCAFDIESGKTTLKMTDKCRVLTSFEFSEEKGNILTLSYSQDISQEPSAAICSSLYLDSTSSENNPANYKIIKAKAIRNKFNTIHNLPLDSSSMGKLEIKTEYLGNVFSDYVTSADCQTSVRNNIENFNNYESTMTLNLEPLLNNVENYTEKFELGDMVKVEGYYRRIVEINESVDSGVETISLTFESSEKSAFRCFIDKTQSVFKNNKWKGST